MYKEPSIYIVSNKHHSVFYIGVTNDLERRILEHKAGIGSVFTSKYILNELLYYEKFQTMSQAIEREKQLKNWHRQWKINLILTINAKMIDLAKDWFDSDTITSAKFENVRP
jgi:putative endonuclease